MCCVYVLKLHFIAFNIEICALYTCMRAWMGVLNIDYHIIFDQLIAYIKFLSISKKFFFIVLFTH